MDPRIRPARELYEKYNAYALTEQYDSVFWLMDTIEYIYSSTAHYMMSFETGVLYNNRAAVYLSLFLQPDDPGLDGDSLFLLENAEKMVRKSIAVYERWISEFSDTDEQGIRALLANDFYDGLDSFDQKMKQKFFDKRVNEIIEAQNENARRLSVSYTNLGTIKRHQRMLDSAAIYYQKAIELWDQNLTAENNLNILLNRPLRKRNLIQKLFPPDK